MSMNGFEIDLHCDQATAVERVTAALGEEGFGVLTTIDVRETLKKKIDVDFRPYTILGACNPQLAHQALSEVPEIGLLLPCNVTVEQAEGASRVRMVNPREMMQACGVQGNPVVEKVAQDAYERLQRVATRLGGEAG